MEEHKHFLLGPKPHNKNYVDSSHFCRFYSFRAAYRIYTTVDHITKEEMEDTNCTDAHFCSNP
jgi:hypothetical protein